MRKYSTAFLLVVIAFSCSPAKKLGLEKSFRTTEEDFQNHVGFMLYDLEKQKTIYEFNSSKYFTPASNTKIFTFYTSLRVLGDSVPALKYIERNDSLIFWGTGDPSFLYKYTFNNNRVYDFLSSRTQPIYFSSRNFFADHFGPGWAWDDYTSAYSSERSPFPIYGNIVTITKSADDFKVAPPFFQKNFGIGERRKSEEMFRSPDENTFRYHPGVGRSKNPPAWDVPIKLNQRLVAELLSDTLNRNVISVNTPQPGLAIPFYSILSDSLYSVMMQESDNFIAEQLLLVCADVLRDTLSTETAIRYALKNFMNDLPDRPVWVDGSGLSRYNLFTPRTIVKLWEKIYQQVPRERLFSLLAVGGKNGTLERWFKNDPPFIFGKTGTLSNNHSLSGFLVTKGGKTLIFCFMNNNYVSPTSLVRKNMEGILKNIYEKY